MKKPVPTARTQGCTSAPMIHVSAVRTLPIAAAAIPAAKQQSAIMASQNQGVSFVVRLSTRGTYARRHKDGVRDL